MIEVEVQMEQGTEFSSYLLDDHLKQALEKLGFERATPIQERAIPHIIAGQDIAGLAQTGTGKTAAFLLPLIERVLRSGKTTGNEDIDKRGFVDWKHNHFNLVLVPTRELAEQVKDCALDFLKGSDHRVVVVYGGVSIEKQIEQLNKGFTFLVATPGRLIDLYKEHKVDLKQVRSVTFDEADRMFDMGFKDDMKYILRRIPEERQLLLFSATLNLDVFNVAYQFGANPVEVKVSQDKTTAENVDDKLFHLGRDEKPGHLLGLLNKLKPKQVIIFTNFKNNVERIAEFLNKNGHKAVGISSLLTQSQRKRVMTRFRSEDGENILVATDVAARGLDIEGVDLVINYELPEDVENYVHRIGRTGRAGEKGNAFSFVSDKDVESLDRIQKYLDRSVVTDWLDDGDLPKDFAPFPAGEPIMNRSRTKKTSGKDRPQGKKFDRDRKDRGDRGDKKDKDPKRKDFKKGNKKKRKEYSEEDKSVHRDKRSGRHRQKDDKSKDKDKNKKPNATGGNKNKKFKKQKPSKEYKVKDIQKPKSLIGKVKSGLKKIFG